MENLIENNELIAEFIGKKVGEGELGSVYEINGMRYHKGTIRFHESWDWLMPVVEKCYDVADDDSKKSDRLIKCITDRIVDLDIKMTHECVVEFIKWYNAQQAEARVQRLNSLFEDSPSLKGQLNEGLVNKRKKR